MTKVRPHKEANRITELWRKFGPGSYPIDITLIVNEVINPSLDGERLELIYHPFDTFDGLMKQVSRGVWAAIVNDDIKYFGRKNFTAAHEVFHFLGHRFTVQEFSCSRHNINDFEIEEMEVEANQFASQLLLPPDRIRKYSSDEFRYETVKELADSLGASVSAVAYKWLTLCGRAEKVGFFISRDGFVSEGYSSDGAYKEGLFFKKGLELPKRSATNKVQGGAIAGFYEFDPGVWNNRLGGYESVHQTHFEDFTYTFITLSD